MKRRTNPPPPKGVTRPIPPPPPPPPKRIIKEDVQFPSRSSPPPTGERPINPPKNPYGLTAIDSKPEPMRVLLAKARSELPAMIENMKIMAKLTRAKYEALKSEGFTDEQAIELSKKVL